VQYTTYDLSYFPSGEVEIKLNIVNNTIYCKLHKDLNKSLISAFIAINKLREIYKEIIVIIPFLPYSRSEIEHIISTFRLIGVSKIITIEIHSEIIQSGIMIQNISLIPKMIKRAGINLGGLVIVAPDIGGYPRAKNTAMALQCDFTSMTKIRTGNSITHILHNQEIVKDKSVLIVDDIIDTGGTINSAAELLYKHGARSIKALAVHGVLSKYEFSNKIEKIYITNTIEQIAISEDIEVIEIDSALF